MSSWRVPTLAIILIKLVEPFVALVFGVVARLENKQSASWDDFQVIFSDALAGVIFVFVFLGYTPISFVIWMIVARIMTNSVVALSVIFGMSLGFYLYIIGGRGPNLYVFLSGCVMALISFIVLALAKMRASAQSELEIPGQ